MSEVGHILVVDDDPEIGRAINAYLSEVGYRVSQATSGAQMREIFKRQTVDLVILDLLLPGENGLDIARRLRAESNFGIIMLTGRAAVVDSIIGFCRRSCPCLPRSEERWRCQRWRFAVADHSKFDAEAMVRLGHVSEIDAFFTDTQLPESIANALKASAVALFLPEDL